MKKLPRILPLVAVDSRTVDIKNYRVTLGGKLAQSTTFAMDSWARDRIPATRGI